VRDLLLFRQDGLGASQVDDHILALEALHDSRDDLVLAILEFTVNLLALGVADMLDEVLLGRLSRDPAHRRGVEFEQDFVANLGVGIVLGVRFLQRDFPQIGGIFDHRLDFKQLDLAQFLVEA